MTQIYFMVMRKFYILFHLIPQNFKCNKYSGINLYVTHDIYYKHEKQAERDRMS